MKIYNLNDGILIDYKNSIITTDVIKRATITRWWITKFYNTWYGFNNNGCYLITKIVNDIHYCMMIDVQNKDTIIFDCYFHFGTIIKESEKHEHFFFEENVINYSLDDVYELYKKGLELWENHSKSIVIS